jgi:hypothetical protein
VISGELTYYMFEHRKVGESISNEKEEVLERLMGPR